MKINKILMIAVVAVGFIFSDSLLATCVKCGCTGQTVNRFSANSTCTQVIRNNTTGTILSDPRDSSSVFGTVCSRCSHSLADHNYDQVDGLLCNYFATEQLQDAASCENLKVRGLITPANCK